MMISSDCVFVRWARVGALFFCFGFTALPAEAGETSYSGPYLAGRLLVAAESMSDPLFHQTVILMLEHDSSGAFGVVLNRAVATGPLGNLLAGFGMVPETADETALSRTIELRHGGPVEPDSAMAIHSTDYNDSGSVDVGGGLAWTLDSAVLEAAAAGRGPNKLLVFFGYAGWSGGQLEKEISQGGWLDGAADASIVFGTPVDDLYATALDAAGLSL